VLRLGAGVSNHRFVEGEGVPAVQVAELLGRGAGRLGVIGQRVAAPQDFSRASDHIITRPGGQRTAVRTSVTILYLSVYLKSGAFAAQQLRRQVDPRLDLRLRDEVGTTLTRRTRDVRQQVKQRVTFFAHGFPSREYNAFAPVSRGLPG
jgi:hypothetical protein